jgi:alkylhydroperoxidase family enzyme
MAFIELVEDAGEPAALSNHQRAFAQRPAIAGGWAQLREGITATMDPRLYELVTLAAACRLRSSYCALAHGTVLVERFLPPDTVAAVVLEAEAAPLTPVELAAVALARKVVEDAAAVTAEDVGELRELGLSDGEIFEIVAAAAARCFFSKTLDALGVQADVGYAELEAGLRDALVVGRPIADA